MDYQTYTTEQDASAAMGDLKGWPDAHIEQLYLPDDADADADGNAWVLSPDTDQYMRTDGYVR